MEDLASGLKVSQLENEIAVIINRIGILKPPNFKVRMYAQ
jgi:hypothetical protein